MIIGQTFTRMVLNNRNHLLQPQGRGKGHHLLQPQEGGKGKNFLINQELILIAFLHRLP